MNSIPNKCWIEIRKRSRQCVIVFSPMESQWTQPADSANQHFQKWNYYHNLLSDTLAESVIAVLLLSRDAWQFRSFAEARCVDVNSRMIDDQKPILGTMKHVEIFKSKNCIYRAKNVGRIAAFGRACARYKGLALKSWLMAINNFLQIDVKT